MRVLGFVWESKVDWIKKAHTNIFYILDIV